MDEYVADLEKRVEELERKVSLDTPFEAAKMLQALYRWVEANAGRYLPSGARYRVRAHRLYVKGLRIDIDEGDYTTTHKIPWDSCISSEALRDAIFKGETYVTKHVREDELRRGTREAD